MFPVAHEEILLALRTRQSDLPASRLPIGYRQRRNGQHKFPAIARGGRLAQRVEIGAVDEVDAQDRQNEIVNRARGMSPAGCGA